ncbi:hypothetical protein ACOMHN_063171 [Nucella lapillus]
MAELPVTVKDLKEMFQALQSVQNDLHKIEKYAKAEEKPEEDQQQIEDAKRGVQQILQDFDITFNIERLLGHLKGLSELRLHGQKIVLKKGELLRQYERMCSEGIFATDTTSSEPSTAGACAAPMDME